MIVLDAGNGRALIGITEEELDKLRGKMGTTFTFPSALLGQATDIGIVSIPSENAMIEKLGEFGVFCNARYFTSTAEGVHEIKKGEVS